MKYYRKKETVVDYTKEEFQKCWTCKNACGGCSWSREFKPVDGWTAEPAILVFDGEKVDTYKIKDCPEYVFG